MPRLFVFGSLMLGVPGLENGRPAVLREYAVRFVARGVPLIEPSFAALVPEDGAQAYGVVFDLDSDKMRELLVLEHGYEKRQIRVTVGGQDETVWAFFLEERYLLPQERTPSLRYLRLLERGAERFDLPPEYGRRLDRLKQKASRLSSYFVLLKPVVQLLTPRLGFPAALGLVVGLLVCGVLLCTYLVWVVSLAILSSIAARGS